MPSNKQTALTVHLPFVGFTYTNKSKLSDNPPCSPTSAADLAARDSVDSDLKDENSRLLTEVESLKKQLNSSSSTSTLGKGPDGKGSSVPQTQLLGCNA